MNPDHITNVPIFYSNQSVKDVLHYLLQNDIDTEHLILCNEKKAPCGIIHMEKFYRDIAFGMQFNHVLEDISDNNYTVIQEDYSITEPELLENQVIIVTDRDGRCLGTVNSTTVLLDYIRRKETLENASGLDGFLLSLPEFGFAMADVHGKLTYLNQTAKKILRKMAFLQIHRLEDVIPRFDYSFSRQTYHLKYEKNSAEIKIYPIHTDSSGIKIALLIFDRSELDSVKKTLEETRAKYNEMLSIIDNSYDEIYATDSNGVCIFVNKTCERIYGLKREDIVGKTSAQMKMDGFISSDLCTRVIDEKHRLREIQTTKIGQKILVIASPIFDKQGKLLRVVINSREIADMMEVRISLDNLDRKQNLNITDRLMELTLKSQKIVAESEQMKTVIKQLIRVSQTNTTVLLTGETGTGKDIMATLIHEISDRRQNSIVKFRCAQATPEQIREELFGCEKKSADGKTFIKRGLFELADKSTIFLDEIDEFPYELQGRLLHVLEDKEFLPSGSTKVISSDFRVIAATNISLEKLMQEGRFRKDLYYRLNIANIHLPPLRERKEDIPLLIQNFISLMNHSAKNEKTISGTALEMLIHHKWKGNVRELKNVIERLYLYSEDDRITEKDLSCLPELFPPDSYSIHDYTALLGKRDMPDILNIFEERLLKESMKQSDSTYSLAKLLGISQATVVRKFQKYNLKF